MQDTSPSERRTSELPTFEHDQTLPGRFHFPTRMTVLPLAERAVALVSPIPIDDAVARAIDALGEVRFLVAPNLFHHLYLGDAMRRYERATVLAPLALARKRPDLRIDASLSDPLPEALGAVVDVIRVAGAPRVDEHAIFHRPSRTLVLTDLVFNLVAPRGPVANAVVWAFGCHGRLAQSRSWHLFVQDRDATKRSLQAIAALPFETLVVAHGDVVRQHARQQFVDAIRVPTIRG